MVNGSDAAFIVKIEANANTRVEFANWQSKFRAQISQAHGFSSLEIISSQNDSWFLNLRFLNKQSLDLWLQSPSYALLLKELTEEHLIANQHAISQQDALPYSNGVVEIYVTYVNEGKLNEFHAWHEKIHKIESSFPGFQKVYIQAPDLGKNERAWITLLQFDNQMNLENWLNSSQRAEILNESQEFIKSKETHQLISSFGGWFNDPAFKTPSAGWKQPMLILAVLYPIVMLQYLYFANYLNFLSTPLKTFVENILSVILLAWLVPVAIYLLSWWLIIKFNPAKNLLGIGILLVIYAVEIITFILLI